MSKNNTRIFLDMTTMDALHRLDFLLEKYHIGKSTEIDIHFTEVEGMMRIQFLVDQLPSTANNHREKWFADIEGSKIILRDSRGKRHTTARVEKMQGDLIVC